MSKKYIVVKPILYGYPRPFPPREKKIEIFRDDREAKTIAKIAQAVGVDKDMKFRDVVERVTNNISSEVMKTWALFRWLGEQRLKEENTEEECDVKEGTPLWYTYKLQSGRSQYYAIMLAILLREVKIPCVIITGKGKGSGYEVGDLNIKGECSWNAAYIEGDWRLLHPQWAFQSLIGQVTSHWIKVEDDGDKGVQDIKPTPGIKMSAVNTFYFLTDPDDFKYFCIPHESQRTWQLLDVPLTNTMYMKLPLISPGFITSRAEFQFRRGQTNIITAEYGECELILTSLNTRWTGQLIYELLYKQESTKEFPQGVDAERYVILSNKNLDGEIKFLIRFPLAGTYRLNILDKQGSSAQWLCSFKLVCNEARARCDPLPVNPVIGWGPGEASKRLGIVAPTHTDGIVESKKEQKMEICFETRPDTSVRAQLKHSHKPDSEIQQYVSKKKTWDSVSIDVNLPDNDEYALVIDAKKANEAFENALNYIITGATMNHQRSYKYRNPREKKLKKVLETEMQGKDKNGLEMAIENFKRLKVEHDNDLLSRAKDRKELLVLKEDLEQAILCGRFDKLQKVILNASKSQHVSQLKRLMDKAQFMMEDLKKYSWEARHLPKEKSMTSNNPRSGRRLPPLLNNLLTDRPITRSRLYEFI